MEILFPLACNVLLPFILLCGAVTRDPLWMEEMYGESLGILKNYRVLNVAITRAKYGLICVGNADVLSEGSKDFNAFIHSLRSCRCILSQTEFLESLRTRRVSDVGSRSVEV